MLALECKITTLLSDLLTMYAWNRNTTSHAIIMDFFETIRARIVTNDAFDLYYRVLKLTANVSNVLEQCIVSLTDSDEACYFEHNNVTVQSLKKVLFLALRAYITCHSFEMRR